MDRILQTTLLILIILIAALARMMAVGWFYLFGVLTIPVFTLIHLKVHLNSRDYLAQKEQKNYLLILASHFLFLCLFFFQFEAGDSPPFTVLENVVGMKIQFVNDYGLSIWLTSLIAYIYVSTKIRKGARRFADNLSYQE